MGQRVDGEALRKAMRHVPSPVTIVTVGAEDGIRGITIGSFASTSLRPPLISFNVSLEAQSYDSLRTASHFAVHVLSDEQAFLSDHFATPDLSSEEQFEGVPYRIQPDGTPIILDTLAVLYCRRHAVYEAGDHSIIVGEVEEIENGLEGQPLLYFDRTYREIGEEVQPSTFEPVGDPPKRAGRS